MPYDPKVMLEKLQRAHKMSVSGPDVEDDATIYGMAAVVLKQVMNELEDAREELRDKRHDAREASERRSWARLVPEAVLYPHYFRLMGTTTGAGMSARIDGNRIYHRNFDGLLQPIPGEVWKQDGPEEKYFLVLSTAEYRNHAVMDVMPYTGPLPTPEESE